MIGGAGALEVIAGLLLPVYPPQNPLILQSWSGFAFDRNRYEDLAPTKVWCSLFDQHVRSYQQQPVVVVEQFQEVGDAKQLLPPRLHALREYWNDGANFLRDHYVLSEGGEWVVRLDQDVTLFAGRSSFMRTVAKGAGGIDLIKGVMTREFGGDAESSLRQSTYIEALTQGLTQS